MLTTRAVRSLHVMLPLCGALLGCCGCAGGSGTTDVPGKRSESIIEKLPRSAIVHARKEMLDAAVLSLGESLGEPDYCDGFFAGRTYFRRLLLLVPKARFVIVDTITKMRLYEGTQADFVSMPSQ